MNDSTIDHRVGLSTNGQAVDQPSKRTAPERSASATLSRIVYLVNQYPAPSLVFVRREIAALEQHGCTVLRFAIRPWPGKLVDPDDILEQARTKYLLRQGGWRLVWAVMLTACLTPGRLARAVGLGVRVGRRSDRGLLRHLVYLAEACLLKRMLHRENASWVHAHFGTNSTTVAMLCHTLGGPRFSFTVHGPEEFDRPESLHLTEKIAHAARVFAVSQFGRSQLYRWCPHDQWGKLHVVPCGLDASYLDIEPTPPPPGRRLLSVGRLHEQKGTLLLIEAARHLVQRGEELELVLVGDGPLRNEVERLVKRHGLEQHVRLMGWQTGPQIRRWLTDSRAFVLPSFAEGLPVAIMESLAMHRPVITTYIAGIPELVTDGQCGWLVPAGDVDALVAAMSKALHASVDELAAMGSVGAARVHRQHDIRDVTQLILRCIDEGSYNRGG